MLLKLHLLTRARVVALYLNISPLRALSPPARRRPAAGGKDAALAPVMLAVDLARGICRTGRLDDNHMALAQLVPFSLLSAAFVSLFSLPLA